MIRPPMKVASTFYDVMFWDGLRTSRKFYALIVDGDNRGEFDLQLSAGLLN